MNHNIKGLNAKHNQLKMVQYWITILMFLNKLVGLKETLLIMESQLQKYPEWNCKLEKVNDLSKVK